MKRERGLLLQQLGLAWRGFVRSGWPERHHRRLRVAHRCHEKCDLWNPPGLRLPLFICRESGHWHHCDPEDCRFRVDQIDKDHVVPSGRVCRLTGLIHRSFAAPSRSFHPSVTHETHSLSEPDAVPAPEVPRFGSLEARRRERIAAALGDIWQTLPVDERDQIRRRCAPRLTADVERFAQLVDAVPQQTSRILDGPLTWVVAFRTRHGLDLPRDGRTYVLLEPFPELELPELQREKHPFAKQLTRTQKQLLAALAQVPEPALRSLALRVV